MEQSHKLHPAAKLRSRIRIPADAPSEPRESVELVELESTPPSSFFLQAFDLQNPEHRQVWFQAMRDAVEDLAGAAEEGTRRLRHRVLSRAEIRRQARSAERSVMGLLDAAEKALASQGPR